MQPLVTRPAYGHGGAATPVGVAQLPSGGPGGKGLPLDPGIPGQATFNKPTDDIRHDEPEDENIHRVDGPGDLLKDRSRIDTREDNADKSDGLGYSGGGKQDESSKTKYPYRDGRPNHHNASAEYVLGLWLLRTAHEITIYPEPMVRTAAKLGEIMQGTSPEVLSKGKACKVTVKRVDVPNLRWMFLVDAGNGAKVVRLKATRQKNVTKFSKMELKVTCSCPAWQWHGPEFHAKSEGYLDGKARGTASSPDVKDPRKHNRVCKHVAAVLSMVKAWDIPKER